MKGLGGAMKVIGTQQSMADLTVLPRRKNSGKNGYFEVEINEVGFFRGNGN